MLLGPNKKKMVSVIVAGMKDKKPDFVQKLGEDSGSNEMPKPEGPEEDSSYGLESSMQSFMSALKSGDAKGAASALKNFVYMCDEGSPAPEGE